MKGVTLSTLLSELVIDPEPYALELVTGIAEQLVAIDPIVSKHAEGWTLDRMPAVDRSILRLSTFELLVRTEIPAAVIIDEAVELAKAYSTEDSGRYVNGVLAAIAREIRANEMSPS